ncbi:MAG: hypothetical protein ACXWLE_08155 [Rhizomicrobium sp.]
MSVSNALLCTPMLGNNTSANGARALRYREHALAGCLSRNHTLQSRIFVCVPKWPGPFDIEIDCVAVI